MEFSSRGSTSSTHDHIKAQASNPRDVDMPRGGARNLSGNRRPLWPLAVVVLALVIGLLAYLLFNRSSMGVASNKYQAVFLTNGQVYFGKLSIQNESIWKLSDVYYLQAKNQSTESDNPQDAAAASNSDVELIKLGNEVHGPDDAMFINKDQALFFENIKDDGTVGKSIKNYLDSKKD